MFQFVTHLETVPQVALTGQQLVAVVHVVHVIPVDACSNATTCISTHLQSHAITAQHTTRKTEKTDPQPRWRQ